MSRTYKNCSPTGYTGQENKPWAMRGLKGIGYEYWSRRAELAMPGKHKSGKKKTHTLERANERCILNDTLREYSGKVEDYNYITVILSP